MKNREEHCEMRWKIWEKNKKNSGKKYKIQKKIVKRHGNYERKTT